MKIKKLFGRIEFYLALIIVVFSCVVQVRSGQFFTGNNIVDLIRSFTIPVMFCIGEMMILISGDTDVSFPAIASLSMFIACHVIPVVNPFLSFVIAMIVGLIIGAINGFIVSYFKFPGLIVTLGTSSICMGVMQGIFKSREYALPEQLMGLSESKIFTAVNSKSGLTSNLPTVTLLMVALLLLGWFLMNRTMLGRGIYAIGGDSIAAKRSGFNVFNIRMFCFCFSGCMAGMIGVLRAIMSQAIHPNGLIGLDMNVIAACVLGGVSIKGGKGTVLGAALGMALLTVISNSLILLGIDTKWQNVCVGAIIIIGTAISALQNKKTQKQLSVQLSI